MTAFIEEHREVQGVGQICRQLPIAPSTCRARAVGARNPKRTSGPAKQDMKNLTRIERIDGRNKASDERATSV